MNIHEFISSGGIQFWSVQKSTPLIILGRDCHILDINNVGLERPNTDIAILQRDSSIETFWRIYYAEQDWWGHVIHTRNEYAIWGSTKRITIGLVMGIFPADINAHDQTIHHIRDYFYTQFPNLGYPT